LKREFWKIADQTGFGDETARFRANCKLKQIGKAIRSHKLKNVLKKNNKCNKNVIKATKYQTLLFALITFISLRCSSKKILYVINQSINNSISLFE